MRLLQYDRACALSSVLYSWLQRRNLRELGCRFCSSESDFICLNVWQSTVTKSANEAVTDKREWGCPAGRDSAEVAASHQPMHQWTRSIWLPKGICYCWSRLSQGLRL